MIELGARAEVEAEEEAETLDELLRGRLRIYQPRRGARVSLDSLLLADFAFASAGGQKAGRVLDLGCGGGVIGLAIAAADRSAELVGVELVPDMVALARRNAALNHAADRSWIVEGDVARAKHLPIDPDSFDLVVSNPPFHAEGEGRLASGAARAIARHEVAASLADFVSAARRFVKPKGRVAFVYPADRLPDLIASLVASSLPVRGIRPVHSVACDPARRVLVLAHRGYRGGAQLLPPLVVHGHDRRSYTAEAARILGEGDGDVDAADRRLLLDPSSKDG